MATKINEHDCVTMKQDSQANDKECSSGTKVKSKRKSKSTRRRLNAAMSNASFHFSDTDSEGELAIITTKISKLGSSQSSQASQASQANPLISVTDAEVTEPTVKANDNLDYLIADGEARSRSRRSSFLENLTDVDEIYSDEADEKDKTNRNLNVVDNNYQGETDLEDMEGDDDIQPTIYVAPTSDILTEFGGEMITTKEGDGPFSVEVRNRLSREEVSIDKEDTQNVPDMPNTDSEDMEGSDDETKLDEAAAYNNMYEDFDVLAASQIFMTNKMGNTLHVPDVEDAISDCHTDVEDVD
ncbi:uncharacterized protein LOC105837309 [Monomorium pharaonis]|uniref:uncharacterized protein LOC105837309 n=1 Tax=Monomorium pharaonis TaxID=307658 RepID=UPI00063FCAA6|nr:uncharacterized protein LOC105837309 [Monomorium pharaonis]